MQAEDQEEAATDHLKEHEMEERCLLKHTRHHKHHNTHNPRANRKEPVLAAGHALQ
jgi:hypothetical protein